MTRPLTVCFCTARLPYPPVSGGTVETFRTVERLAGAGHDVTVVAYCDDRKRAREMAEAAGCRVVPVPGLPDTTPWTLARNLVSPYPHAVMKSRTDRYRRAVEGVLREEPVDVVHLHTFQVSALASDLSTTVPVVVRFTNVKSELYRQFAGYTDNPAKAAYATLQYRKARRYEPRVVAASDRTLAITDEDATRLRRGRPVDDGTVDVLQTGFDPQPPGDAAAPPAGRPTVTFFGSMDYHPNEDAAVWFAEEVFPAVRRADGDAVFEVVGANPTDRVRALTDHEGVRVTGFVEDIDAYVDRATVVVVPVRIGTGVRIKLLHAMARGKAVVSTPVGAQGVGVEDEVHLRLAERPEQFAVAVRDLLADPETRRTYGESARDLVDREYRWSRVVERLEQQYERLVGPASASPDTTRP
ncbi:glycosyltransferase [Halomarina litorea]|uniref:glycosyltransferase n=1 Tax=Halomarina litorea TaxID=2961595 RepID=UPI0020C4732E|nr:glycosyltransferase [Halomarina sp. BCD28]